MRVCAETEQKQKQHEMIVVMGRVSDTATADVVWDFDAVLVPFRDSVNNNYCWKELNLLDIRDIAAVLNSDPGLSGVLKTAADAAAWLLFTGRYAYACVLLIPLSTVISRRGSGTSHTSSSPGSSLMSSLSKNRFRDSESCKIKWNYCYELLLLFQRWPTSFYRTVDFFI